MTGLGWGAAVSTRSLPSALVWDTGVSKSGTSVAVNLWEVAIKRPRDAASFRLGQSLHWIVQDVLRE